MFSSAQFRRVNSDSIYPLLHCLESGKARHSLHAQLVLPLHIALLFISALALSQEYIMNLPTHAEKNGTSSINNTLIYLFFGQLQFYFLERWPISVIFLQFAFCLWTFFTKVNIILFPFQQLIWMLDFILQSCAYSQYLCFCQNKYWWTVSDAKKKTPALSNGTTVNRFQSGL